MSGRLRCIGKRESCSCSRGDDEVRSREHREKQRSFSLLPTGLRVHEKSWIPGRGLRPPDQVRGRPARNDESDRVVIPAQAGIQGTVEKAFAKKSLCTSCLRLRAWSARYGFMPAREVLLFGLNFDLRDPAEVDGTECGDIRNGVALTSDERTICQRTI